MHHTLMNSSVFLHLDIHAERVSSLLELIMAFALFDFA
jgi:hypothetical protein